MTDSTSEQTDAAPADEHVNALRNEAKKWRLQFRDEQKQAEELRGKIAELEAQVERVTGERDGFVKDLEGLKQAQEHAKHVQEVADEFGVPTDVLRGATRDELKAHAEQLKPVYAKANGPFVPNIGQQPEQQSSDERTFVRELFSSE